ncbi:hypothetical protein MBLNU459_g2134t1 [Dothideomycetes sp. NU459]
MEEDTTSDYDNSHRAFLQAFMGCAVMTFEQAKPILAAILTAQEQRETLPNDITEAGFSNYVATCNNAISRFDFEIRSTLSQHDRTRVWALVNTTSDAITQLATTHSADEINYVKRVLDAMFETHNTRRREIMAIRSKEAINLHRPSRNRESGAASNGVNTQNGGEAPTGQGLSMSQAERVLDGLVEEGWFERSGAGFYSLSPRALMELRQWLIETYNEPPGDDEDEDDQIRQDRIKLCQACKEIVTIVSYVQAEEDWGCKGLHE